ncbi:TRIM9_67 [Mytilus coruscus]|uniref:TRIM9_67 n=1 Tax=Mytilus coruscus TaxID=42192 RepID=A0A6J8A603_MYTCO|nr:TRIM9_67 [Mytilus coruscus]
MAQNLLKCQFCKRSSEVMWKCKTCEVFFCDPCRINIHALLKNAHEHDVTDYKEMDTKCSDRVNLKSIPCSTHPEHSCLMFCRVCEKSLCSSCLINPFDHEELTRIYNVRRESLRELKHQIENVLPFFEEKCTEFQDLESNSLSQYHQIRRTISERQNALTQEAEELFKQLDDFWNPADNALTQEKERLTTIEKDLKQRKSELANALEESSPSSIFPVYEKINRDIPSQMIANVKTPDLIYVKSSSNDSYFGSITQVPELNLVHTFTIALPDISAIATINAETSVLYSAKTNRFQHFTISNLEIVKCLDYNAKNNISNQFNSSARVVDMTEYRGNILISDELLGDEIMHICHSVSQTKFTSISDLKPCGVHTTSNIILLGYCSSYRHNEKSGIIILDSIGKEIRRFECNARNEEMLFTFPAKITTNINNDICIIDYKSFYTAKNPRYGTRYTYESRSGRVVTLGEWGQPKWTYSGQSCINCYDTFTPYDIVTTMHGHILIADGDSSTNHVVSNDGEFVTKFCHDDIVHPNSLNIDKMGRLLVGCSSDWDGGNHEDDARRCKTSKLHVVELIDIC